MLSKLHTYENRVESLTKTVKEYKKEVSTLIAERDATKNELTDIKAKQIDQEAQQRRCNLIITGIPE